MSNSGICAEDAQLRMNANLIGLKSKQGNFYLYWRKKIVQGAGVVLVDRDSGQV